MEKLYYIASNHPVYSHAELVDAACSSGIKLIQLRMKGFLDAQVLQETMVCKEICDYFDAKLILNDYVEIAAKASVYGVHLGQQDMNLKTARAISGNKLIIGGTANTLEHIQNLADGGIDYIGLGPFRFTQTKKNLSPVLGLEGYRQILPHVPKHIPVYAIGGIKMEDVAPLMKTGIHGIAVSGVLTGHFQRSSELLKMLHESNERTN